MATVSELPVGALAWWRVRDPLKTAVEPQRLPVVILSHPSPSRARVEVQHVPGTVRDGNRLPGERFTVTLAKLTPRARP